jgi:hypothetical protein
VASSPRIDLTIKLENDQSIRLALRSGFDARTLASYQNRAALEAAKALVKPMRAAAPSGGNGKPELRQAVKARRAKTKGGGALVGIKRGKGGVWYGTFAVKAIPPHQIPSGKRFKFLSFRGINTKLVQHPGKKANPFVNETGDRESALAERAYAETVLKLLNDKQFEKNVRGLRARLKR